MYEYTHLYEITRVYSSSITTLLNIEIISDDNYDVDIETMLKSVSFYTGQFYSKTTGAINFAFRNVLLISTRLPENDKHYTVTSATLVWVPAWMC